MGEEGGCECGGREGVSSCGCMLGVHIFVAVGLEEIGNHSF